LAGQPLGRTRNDATRPLTPLAHAERGPNLVWIQRNAFGEITVECRELNFARYVVNKWRGSSSGADTRRRDGPGSNCARQHWKPAQNHPTVVDFDRARTDQSHAGFIPRFVRSGQCGLQAEENASHGRHTLARTHPLSDECRAIKGNAGAASSPLRRQQASRRPRGSSVQSQKLLDREHNREIEV
jgi:hypothetical protein